MEVWKCIDGFENRYEVSNCGNVRSLERIVKFGSRERTIKNRLLNKYKYTNGYQFVCLSDYPDSKQYLLHRLVALAFIPNPENKETVNHKDGDKKNNNVENLEWATRSENSQHFVRELQDYPERKCDECSSIFKPNRFNQIYCSATCRSTERRKSGKDDEVRVCECGEKFMAWKYGNKKYCSKHSYHSNFVRL